LNPSTRITIGWFFCALAFAAGCGVAQAQKTDIVVMVNGDEITGEITTLERGRLNYKSDHMTTLSIKWEWVSKLASSNWFLVTHENGGQYYGQLLLPEREGILRVAFLEQMNDIPLDDVVRIRRIKKDFWARVDISVSLGFSYTQASDVAQLTSDGSIAYRDRIHGSEFKYNVIYTDRGESVAVEDRTVRRFDISGTYERTITGRLFGSGVVSAQRNDELGLKLRLLGGGTMGYRLIETGHQRLSFSGGLNINREWSTSGSQVENNVEGVVAGSYSLYYYESPKVDIAANGTLFPSLTIDDRYRAEGDLAVSYEVFNDFFIELSYYVSFDSKPPASKESAGDQGTFIKIRWKK